MAETKKKITEKYTKQEITEMADKCFKRCKGWSCDHYEPVSVSHSNSENLFTFCSCGCYYAFDLPWEHSAQWCIFWGLKNTNEETKKLSNILDALTWKNVSEKTK